MPINLLKLPFLVQEEVFQHMSYNQLFLVSTVNSRVRKSIELVRFNIPRLRFVIDYGQLIVSVSDGGKNQEEIIHVSVLPYVKKKYWKMVLKGNYKVFAGFLQETRSFGNVHIEVLVSEIDRTFLKALQNHISSLFQFSGFTEYVGEVSPDLNKTFDMDNINVTSLTEFRREADIENYFTRHSNHKSARLNYIVLQEDSVLLRVSSLYIWNRNHKNSSYVLHNFKGEHLVLNISITTSDILQFLIRWMSSEAYENLKTVRIHSSEWFYNNNQTISETFKEKAIRYDKQEPTARPEYVVYDPKIIDFKPEKWNLRTPNFLELRRRADNKRAFVSTSPKFLFYVLNDVK